MYEFIHVCLDGDINKVKKLLEDQEVVDNIDDTHNLVFEWACIRGHLDVVKELIQYYGSEPVLSECWVSVANRE